MNIFIDDKFSQSNHGMACVKLFSLSQADPNSGFSD